MLIKSLEYLRKNNNLIKLLQFCGKFNKIIVNWKFTLFHKTKKKNNNLTRWWIKICVILNLKTFAEKKFRLQIFTIVTK